MACSYRIFFNEYAKITSILKKIDDFGLKSNLQDEITLGHSQFLQEYYYNSTKFYKQSS
jgi:hypothetical protein